MKKLTRGSCRNVLEVVSTANDGTSANTDTYYPATGGYGSAPGVTGAV
jgi:hypothetical protein